MITIRHIHDIYIHQHPEQESEYTKLLKQLLNLNQNIMATVKELSEKADLLQATIDETQATALEKITALETTVQELKDIIAAGGDPAALQAVADKLDAATADLKSTFPPVNPLPE